MGDRMPEDIGTDEVNLVARTGFGEPVSDPHLRLKERGRNGMDYGKIMHPGGASSILISLNRWAFITEPGRYVVVGTYLENPDFTIVPVAADLISITVLPRAKEETDDYVKDLTNQIAVYVGGHDDLFSTKLSEAEMKVLYARGLEAFPTLLGMLFEAGRLPNPSSHWPSDYMRETLGMDIRFFMTHLPTSAEGIIERYDYKLGETKPIVGAALASKNPVEWQGGAWLAAQYYDDSFTARLIAIASDTNTQARPGPRQSGRFLATAQTRA